MRQTRRPHDSRQDLTVRFVDVGTYLGEHFGRGDSRADGEPRLGDALGAELLDNGGGRHLVLTHVGGDVEVAFVAAGHLRGLLGLGRGQQTDRQAENSR